MNNSDLQMEIDRLASETMKNMERYGYSDDIINILSEMAQNIASRKEVRSKLAGGLARLTTEAFAFSESRLGQELLDLADRYSQ